jgi:hypothetical protein
MMVAQQGDNVQALVARKQLAVKHEALTSKEQWTPELHFVGIEMAPDTARLCVPSG